MALPNKVIARLAQPFEGGGGPSHTTVDRIWTAADAYEYLGEGNKAERVLGGLRSLRDGRRASAGQQPLPPDPTKLDEVASELATRLVAQGLVDPSLVNEALEAQPEEPPQATGTGSAIAADSAADSRETAPALGGDPSPHAEDRRAVMVVHGQDGPATRALFDWLRSIGLRPSEWNQLVTASGTASPFVGEVVENAFKHAQAVVVLLTPDEDARLRDELADQTPPWRLQARPNVLFEAGMAFARHPTRTVLVVLGEQDLPSDLAGRHYVRVSTPQQIRDLAQRLEAAGCLVDLSGSDWLDMSRFRLGALDARPRSQDVT